MVDVGMHPAVAKQAEEMELALAAALHGLLEQRNLIELMISDELVDARDVHVHNAAGTDVEVADFAVAHLALGETNRGSGCLDQRVREFVEEFIVNGLTREGDGIALSFGAVTPAVQHRKYHGLRSFWHRPSGYTQE